MHRGSRDPPSRPWLQRLRNACGLADAGARDGLREVSRALANLVGGFLSSRLVSIGGLIVFSYFSGPEPFAAFGVYVAAATVLWIVVGGRYDQAIVFAADDAEADALAALSLLIGLVMVAVTALGVVVLAAAAIPLPASLDQSAALLLLPLSLAFRLTSRIALNRATREGAFVAFARAMQGQAVTQAATQVGLLALGVEPVLCLAAADALGHAAATLFVRPWFGPRARRAWSAPQMAAAAARWRQMPAWNLPTSLMSVLALTLPAFVLPLGYPPAVAGQIVFAMRLLELPSNIVRSAASPVMQKALKDAGDPARVVARSLASLIVAAAAVFCGIAVAGLVAHPLFAATRWELAAEAAAWLAPFYVGLTVSAPLIGLVTGFRSERSALPVHAAFLAAMATACLAIVAGADWRLVLAGFGGAMLVRALAFAVLLRRQARAKTSDPAWRA